MSLGAEWAGGFNEPPKMKAHAIIDTTPVWGTIVQSLSNLLPGGRLVINAIRKENIDKESLLFIDYPEHLWMEKEIKSVANIVRQDVEQFLQLAASIPIISEVEPYAFERANEALVDLKEKHVKGAKVLIMRG
jgi:propanol-preferring alcohol dehydrogenase